MNHVSKKLSMKNRRGVSNIIGSLIVLAVVASVGSVILFQGLNQINAFNHELTLHDKVYSDELREDIIFEHIHFDPVGSDVVLNLANVGSIDSTIATVTIVKIDTQEIIVERELVNQPIQLEDNLVVTLSSADLSAGALPQWDDAYFDDKNHKISLTTSKGNFFDTVAKPPNT